MSDDFTGRFENVHRGGHRGLAATFAGGERDAPNFSWDHLSSIGYSSMKPRIGVCAANGDCEPKSRQDEAIKYYRQTRMLERRAYNAWRNGHTERRC